ncbi:MAG TPA: hypothetical protein VI643_08065 [Planctomycetota bacterium]|nr:hypothetical protein [Planctomycetota bacterium]
MDWIKQEKKFVAIVGSFVVTLMLWSSMIRSPASQAIAEARADRATAMAELNAFNDKGVPTPEQIAVAKEALASLKKAVASEEAAVAYIKDPRFVPASGITASAHFDDKRAGANQELQTMAMVRSIAWRVNNRTVGFSAEKIPDGLGDEYLVRLATIYRVIGAIGDLPNGSFSAIQEIAPVEAGGWGAGGQDSILRPEAYVDRIPVRIKFEGKGPAVFKMLHNLSVRDEAQNRTCLRIASFTAERPDANLEKLVVNMTVETIIVRPGKPLTPADATPPEENR